MSLLSDFQDVLKDEPTAGPHDFEDEVVSDLHVYSGRWTETHRAVFKRGDEYVALDYEVPATEYQEGSEAESFVYAVEPYEVTVTKYREV